MQVWLNGTISGLRLAVFALAFMIGYLFCRVFSFALAGIFKRISHVAWKSLCDRWTIMMAPVRAFATAEGVARGVANFPEPCNWVFTFSIASGTFGIYCDTEDFIFVFSRLPFGWALTQTSELGQ